MAENKKADIDIEVIELVRKAKSGNEAAFGELYDLYFDKVYRFVYFRVNHKETAEDLVSDTFIRAWGKLPEIASVNAFNGWIFQIARNLVIDYYRAKKPTLDLTELENVLEYEDNILDRANFGFRQQAFLSALKTLASDQQLVIKLKFLDDLDNAEIAQILGKTEGAIRVIQHRAIKELKQFFEDNSHDD